MSTEPGGERIVPARGALIDRYVVLGELGVGAMGVVLAAYDPELDRQVALKLLKAYSANPDAAGRRLLREAQALAKLTHPNVVIVHDVGIHKSQLFLAMEYVEGQTLSAWLASAQSPRPWREVLKVFTAAGRGLAAAHNAGLVHRDFKPDNVMLGADGRVRVMDFGLARAEEDRDTAGASLDPQLITWDTSASIGDLTQTGALLGTPAYMPLEQLLGGSADTRSDQFGFCVALYEALYATRPFAGETFTALIEALGDGEITPAPNGTKVPAWLRKVVTRGLAPDQRERYASMEALLAALTADPSIRRRRAAAGIAVAGLLVGCVWGLVQTFEREAPTCVDMRDKLADVWDDDRRAEVETALVATDLSYAPATWALVERQLDAYTSSWVAARTEACEATQRGEQSGELLDLRIACLDGRLDHVRARVDLLADADAVLVDEAVETVVGLPDLARCADLAGLRAAIPPPEDPEIAARVREIDRYLVEAAALRDAGKHPQSLTLLETAALEAETLGYAPVLARAWGAQGNLQVKNADFEGAQATLERAYALALSHRMLDEAASASALLVAVFGFHQTRYEDAETWAIHAEPLAEAVGTDVARARLESHLGGMAEKRGRLDAALPHFERAFALLSSALPPDHPEIARTLNDLGIVATSRGDYPEARAYLERALAMRERALGPDHPDVRYSLVSLGVVAGSEGDYARATQRFEQALAITERTRGPDHPDLSTVLANLGTVASMQGDYAKARGYHQRALAIEQSRDPGSLGVAFSLASLATVTKYQGDYASARVQFERAIPIFEAELGPEHTTLGSVLTNFGNLEQVEGRYEDARALYVRALKIKDATLKPDHPGIAYPLTGLGQALLELDKPDEALPYLERALKLRSSGPVDPGDLGDTCFALADALWRAAGRAQHERALKLAHRARDIYVGTDVQSIYELSDVEAWIRERAG